MEEQSQNTVQIQLTNAQKWWISIGLGILFFIVGSPVLYGFTNNISRGIGLCEIYRSGGGISVWGLLLHSVVFALIVRGLLQIPFQN